MSQNDFNIANQGFPSFRSDLNGALQALASNSAGTSAPATTYAYMWWYDSTNNVLKMRNADNDAWINFASFNQATDTWSVAALTVDGAATVAGDLTVDTNTLYVDSTNNRVGVGTTSPAFALGSGLEVERAGIATLRLENSSGSNGVEIAADSTTNGIRFYGLNNAPFVFAPNASERMRLDASGNLLVGTTIANGNFSVQGSTAASYSVYSVAHPTNGYNIACRGTTTTGVAVRFLNSAGSDVGSIDYTSTVTLYTTSSDYRLKEDVQPMVGASERVLALNPVNFAWKADGTRVDGFIAHEAQEVVPGAVHGVKDGMRTEEYEVTPAVYDEEGNFVSEAVMGTREVPEYQGIDQSKLVPLLTAALQEALKRIEALEAKV